MPSIALAPLSVASLGALSTLLALGCVLPGAGPKGPKTARDRVESLWDLAPHDAVTGLVMGDGGAMKVLALIDTLGDGPARKELEKSAEKRGAAALPGVAFWPMAGLDASLGAAAFTWADKNRGALLVLPVTDRVRFRAALNLKTSLDGNREVDEVGDGYKCMPAAGRYLCAKSADDIEAAAAIHQTPLAPAVQKLSPDDRGDIEFYADTRAPDVAKYAKEAEKLGKVTAIAGAIHLRGDSVSLRAHVIGSFDGPIAKALAGAPPPAFFSPSAAGATTVVRFHLEPAALVTEPEKMEPKTRTELVEQLGGDIEVTTSGHGLAGVYGVATLKDAGRVEAFVKKTCEETGGSKLKYALGKIAVTEHGCSAVFDPRMILLPVNMQPLPVAARVEGGRLVFTVGDATAPVANQRSLAGVAKDSDAEWALTDKEALVAFTRGPFVGPDLGAGKAFKNLASMVSDKQADQAEAFNDVMSHVAQAMMAVKVTEDGVILSAEAVTFDRDPEGPRKVYREALEARRKGDVAGYQQRLADIEKRFPTSLAAQRAAELRRDPPWLGAGLVALSSLGTPGKKK